jgi:hypothetical protein
MTEKQIQQMIDDAIRDHEIRVGWISGIIGALFTFGIVHAIWLIKIWIH